MDCQGAVVVASLVQNNHVGVAQVRSAVKASPLWAKHKDFLERYVCRRCAFRAEDCDFQSPSPSEDLEPCGGVVVLASLKEDDLIDEHVLGTL